MERTASLRLAETKTTDYRIVITDDRYNAQSIADGLESGDLDFDGVEGQPGARIVKEDNEEVAVVKSQTTDTDWEWEVGQAQ